MSRLWENLSRLDTFLLAAGVVAAILYVASVSSVSPDAYVSRTLSTEQILEIAESFVRAHGGSVEDMTPSVSFKREKDLLEAAQVSGRSGIRSALVDKGLPGYSFEVQFLQITSEPKNFDAADRYFLKISPSGKVWYFNDKSPPATDSDPRTGRTLVSGTTVDRAALWAALSEDSTMVTSLSTILSWDDSTLVRRMRFDLRDFFRAPAVRTPDSESPPPPAPNRPRGGLDRIVFLSPANAIVMAERYLNPAAFDSEGLEVDSIWVEGGSLAGIRFENEDEETGIVEQVDVKVTPVGGLQELTHKFLPVAPIHRSRLHSIRPIVSLAIYFLLSTLLLIVFFRQLMVRALDVRAALIDSILFSVSFVVFVLLSSDLHSATLPTLIRLAIFAAALGIGGGLMALIVFLASASADSLARRRWSKKLVHLSLARQGSILNSFIGSAIIRGVAVGSIALAVSMVSLAIFQNAPIEIEAESFAAGSIQPAVAGIGYALWIGYFKSLLLIMTVGAVLYRPGRTMLFVVLPIALVFGLAGTGVLVFSNVWLSWFTGVAVGLVFALGFWYFDVVVCFVGLVVYTLVSVLQEGFIMSGSPYWADASLGVAVLVGLLALGFVGISRGRPSGSNLEYVPQYLKEMGEQQRLQRELEIARHVQESFLPKTMPVVDQLDIAAICIPAQQVGGDYYDFVSLSGGRLGIALGDVSGKGIQAAFFMTLTKGFLRAASRESDSPAVVLEKVNSLFRDSAPRGTFISLVYGVFDMSRHTFTFGRAGHNPVIVKKSSDPEAELVQPSGLGIGLASEAKFSATIAEQTISLESGDLVVLFTDGFSEARSLAKEEYGDQRLARMITRHANATAAEIVDAVCHDVVFFCGSDSTHDDRTVMVIKVGNTNRHPAS